MGLSYVCACVYVFVRVQEERAGKVKEMEGDYQGAVALYLKGGLPARAAQVGVGVRAAC